MAEPLTRLTVEQVDGAQRIRTVMVIDEASVAFLADSGRLNSFYNSETGDLWLLDHERQLAQKINREEVQIFADRLANEVAKFEASIASLPEDEKVLAMKRFEQLFERANQRAAGQVDRFVPQDRAGEFAGIPCQWHDMIEHQNSGDKLVGIACLAETHIVAQGQALASFFSDLAAFSKIVKDADTGPIEFPVIGNLLALPSGPGMMAIKISNSPDFSNLRADMEVISASTESHSSVQHLIPKGYRKLRFSESL
ncbi:hypothetical protein [Marinobacter sp.]|uniref:hypothetical protein n=1 Tax=Marinobacter sp. TaxID=50741 RepID=UPI003A9224A7